MNHRFMLIRNGENPTWQEWIALSLIVLSVLNWISYGMWPGIAPNFTLLLGAVWIFSGTAYSFSQESQKRRRFKILLCWVCGLTILALLGTIATLVGIVTGILLFIYAGKDFHQPKKDEK